MLVLFETAAGYALFKLLDDRKLSHTDNLYHDFETPEAASKVVKLKHFEKFRDTTEALAATTAAVEGKLSKSLKKMLKKMVVKEAHEQLLVADAKLGNAIKDKFELQCLSNTAVQELMRCIRSQMENLLAGLPRKEMTAMALGLAHSLSRYKLKFSPDKIDTMIVQAVGLLDELDKELNNYIMRTREWYGWHFPELGKIISDNLAYVKTIKLIGTRDNAGSSDLSDILPEEIEAQVKEAAEISMGTEISDQDIINIQHLCDQVIEISSYRAQLYDYLHARMIAMAPNLTILVGELVGARLIAHAGSLVNLAKHPASTVQILGAEKALFRALKTKRDTPKYGLIYHSQLVGQANAKNKGKISRMLAAKAALATRVDALGEDGNIEMGAEHKLKIEKRLRLLEEGNLRRISGTAKAKAKFEKYHSKSEVRQYPAADDSTLPSTSKRRLSESEFPPEEKPSSEKLLGGELPPKKKRKIKQEEGAETSEELSDEIEHHKRSIKIESQEESEGETPKKKKKKQHSMQVKTEEQSEPEGEQMDLSVTDSGKKKKKKNIKVEESEEAAGDESAPLLGGSEKKKKKNRKSHDLDDSNIGGDETVASLGSNEKKKKKKKKKRKSHDGGESD